MSRTRRFPIAILTDFGCRDHYVGVMKGAIARIAPEAPIIDISHGIPHQSVMAGALALRETWRFFPQGTVFLAVVDPGVGTARLPIAIETRAGARFVGPDNGLTWLAARDAEVRRAVELRSARYRLSPVSATFHGRDIFAPAAAWLWRGLSIRRLGPELRRIEPLELPPTRPSGQRLDGEVVYVDRFGNLVTNIDRTALDNFQASFPDRRLLVKIKRRAPLEIRATYGDVPQGAPLAAFTSFGLLEVAVRGASAAEFYSLGPGARVMIEARG